MIMWKGMGLIIFIFLGLSLYLTGLMFDETLKRGQLHYGAALLLTGFILRLMIWKKGKNDKKYLNHEDPIKRENYRKTIKSNPVADLDGSTLFFIPFVYWQYIMWSGGSMFLVSHYLIK